MLLLNRLRVEARWAYAMLAAALWIAMQYSGVTPTMAIVLAGLTVHLTGRRGGHPLHRAEHLVRPYLLYGAGLRALRRRIGHRSRSARR